jgi:NO-binding membrane sensor protein with MHYT domain
MEITILNVLAILSSVTFLVAVYFAFKLSKETKHERYWMILALGFFIFALHHWLMTPFVFNLSEEISHLIEHISSIIGAILIGYSVFGLYNSMKKINRKTE